MSITKKFLKSKPVCKVSFKLDNDAATNAENASIVGDFNNWDKSASPMKKLKNGSFSATLDLETGKEYQFRYYLGDDTWQNEPGADKEIPTEFHDARNSVLAL